MYDYSIAETLTIHLHPRRLFPLCRLLIFNTAATYNTKCVFTSVKSFQDGFKYSGQISDALWANVSSRKFQYVINTCVLTFLQIASFSKNPKYRAPGPRTCSADYALQFLLQALVSVLAGESRWPRHANFHETLRNYRWNLVKNFTIIRFLLRGKILSLLM